MQFVAIGLFALFLGFRGFRAQGRTYLLCGVAATAATLYIYHFQ
jgi:hypothetical protein